MKKMFLVATLLPLMATTAQAQDDRVERLEVTGSHIKRIDVEGPSPIQMLDREFLDNSGYNSVSDVLRDITASAFGGARESAGSNAAGVATVNLRGLGADRTLVLLDGKRLPTDPISGAVDLNLIPMGAVQRIDILKDGASATYGSDALGGVVNIVTRKDFVGSEVSIRSSINKDEGGERTDASLLHGYANNKFRIIGVANFRTNKEIKSKDRKWSEEGFSTFAVPANRTPVTLDGDGNITGSTGPMEPSPNCPADMLQNGLCAFKYTEYSDEVPSIDQLSLMVQAEYRISPDITAYARVIGNQNKVKWQYAPNAASYIDSTTVLGTNYLVRDRMLELGPRISDGETKSFGIQTGVKGYMFDTWSWDITYDYNNLKREVKNPGGYALNDRLAPLIQSGAYNPYAVFGSRIAAGQQSAYDNIKYAPWNISESTNHFAEAKMSGELFYMFGRPVNAAFGTMFSSEEYTNKIDQESLDGNVLGHAGSTGGGDRTIISAYSELAFNPVESVEVQLAGRFDNYDDFGSTVNPKIGLRWQANSQLMFRASAGTGFKAPTLVELYQSSSIGNPTFKDEYACAQLGGAYCQAQQYEVKQGGNKDLKEEKSVSYNLGAMYQIARRTSFGLDLWMVELEDAVGMDLNKATEYERRNGAGSAAQHGIAITRDNQGRIITMDAKLQNLGSRDLTGLDVTFSHGQNTFAGDFSIKMEHSHMLKYEMETFPGLGVESILGDNGAPRWRNNITFGYVPSFHQASSIYLIAKTTAANDKSDETKGELKRYTEWDFQYNLQLPWKATATLGVINLFGSTPPLDETSANEKLNASLYNPIGQSFYLQYVQSF